MSDLPNGWLAIRLGQAVDYGKTEKIEPDAISHDDWILELEDIERDTSKIIERVLFSERKSKSTKNKFSTGDVLYGKLRPYLNKVVVADSPGFCTTEIIPLKSNEVVFSRYLFYWLKHPDFLEYVNSVSHGLSMPRLGTEAGKDAPFILAPFREQQRIVEKLDSLLARVDATRERLDRIPKILKHFRQSVLAAATNGALTESWREANLKNEYVSISTNADDIAGVTYEVPTQWRWGPLSDGISEASYGTSSKSSRAGKIPVLRMGNLQNGKLDWQDLVYSNNDLDNKKYILEENDVLFNRTNSPELVGKTSIYQGEAPAIYAGYLIRVRCIKEKLNPRFVNYCLNSDYGRAYCWAVKSDGVSQSNINAQKLRAFPVPYCSIDEQGEIVRRVERLFAFAEKINARYKVARKQIDKLTPSLLAKAFRGELVEQDPNDEPSEKLLERTKGNKKTATPTKKSPSTKVAKRK